MNNRVSLKCDRCNIETDHFKTLFMVRPGGHSLPSLAQPDPIPPNIEHVCAKCITDDELVMELGPVAAFVLGVMLKRNAEQPEPNQEWAKIFEMARTPFIVRNINPDDNTRSAALRAVGL